MSFGSASLQLVHLVFDPTAVPFECVEGAPQRAMSASALLFTFLTITYIMLLNMLIAMLAKTFDTVYEAQEINYQYLRAKMLIFWDDQPVVPPPLNLLGAPFWAQRRWGGGGGAYEDLEGAAEAAEAPTTEPKLSVFEGDKPMSAEDLRKLVTDYVDEHEDEVEQSGRWRASIHRVMAETSKKIDALQKRLDERLDELKA